MQPGLPKNDLGEKGTTKFWLINFAVVSVRKEHWQSSRLTLRNNAYVSGLLTSTSAQKKRAEGLQPCRDGQKDDFCCPVVRKCHGVNVENRKCITLLRQHTSTNACKRLPVPYILAVDYPTQLVPCMLHMPCILCFVTDCGPAIANRVPCLQTASVSWS